ncbi:MAG: hypothetical protein OEY64_03660 [Nitrospinota bacterium]|nr:hypothetical protein [Nitrospinota bacterium]
MARADLLTDLVRFGMAGHKIAFLEVLDRRRYEQNLTKGSTERFKATGRRKLNG